MRKNLVLLFPSPVRLAGLRLTEFGLIVGSAVFAAIEVAGGRRQAAAVPALVAVVLYTIFVGRIRKAHFSWEATALALLGLPVFSYLLLRSKLCHEDGSVVWKGRTYPGIDHAGTDALGRPAEDSSEDPAHNLKSGHAAEDRTAEMPANTVEQPAFSPALERHEGRGSCS